MRHLKLTLGNLILFIIGLSACKVTPNSEADPRERFRPDYYLQFEGTEERLAQLIVGEFSCYSVRKKDTWYVNEGQDSIIAYNCLIGDPSKDGTWVYSELYMTHFPEQPLIQYFFHIERQSPDTLTMTEYQPKDKTDNPYIRMYSHNKRSFNLDDLEDQGCPRVVIKHNQTTFQALSQRCPQIRKGKKEWSDINIIYRPENYRVEVKSFDHPDIRPENSTKFHHTILYYKRLPTVNE